MDPTSKIILGTYTAGLAAYGLWGGAEAIAQDGGIPSSFVSSVPGVGPTVFDLGNLTTPSALVVCTFMLLRFLERLMDRNDGRLFSLTIQVNQKTPE